MLTTKFEVFNTGTLVWDDKTGTALNGVATTRPQWAISDDKLVFTNEGLDRPRKFDGSANTANIWTGDTDPPYCKSVEFYKGFLMMGNVSDDGTFTDIANGWRRIIYCDAWETGDDCSACEENFIILDETPGDLVAMKVLGRSLICYKNDGIVRSRWVGGAVRFTQDLLPIGVGTVSPLSVVRCGEIGHVFLGVDGILYKLTDSSIKPVSREPLAKTIDPKKSLERFQYARGFVLEEKDVYVLLYDRTGLAGQLLDSYVLYNFRTGEFDKGELGSGPFVAGTAYRNTKEAQEIALLATANLVKEWDTANQATDDDGTAINRFWTTGWQRWGDAEGHFIGARVILNQSPRARISVSVATDLNETFVEEEFFSLKPGKPSDTTVELSYRPEVPIRGQYFNVKVKLYHDHTSAKTELVSIGPESEREEQVVTTRRVEPGAASILGG